MIKYETTDSPGLVKDRTRGHVSAVLNTDNARLAEYRTQRARLRRVDRLEAEVSELKQIVKSLLGMKNV